MIEAYEFGMLKVSGKTYRNDVIIYPDHIDAQWWRKQGHFLDIDDIREVIAAKPEVIIVGTGQPGLMRVDEQTLATIKKMNIEAIVVPTNKACEEYNRIASAKKVIACLHLTC